MKEFIAFSVGMILIIVIIILLGFSLGKNSCLKKYQVEVNDKWIPAESYYFKEE